MIVYRADPNEVDNIDIEIMKKPGKNFGLGFYVGNPRGLFITDIVSIKFDYKFWMGNQTRGKLFDVFQGLLKNALNGDAW